ncbi:MAG: hypothetical protein RBT03_02475 [Kiritimatiellia bacterium]|nr:hypothetical protein [Kiritimatiellia bacterium]
MAVLMIGESSKGWAMERVTALEENTATPQAIPVDQRVEDFDSLDGWRIGHGDGVEATMALAPGMEGPGISLDYNLGKNHSFALISKDIPLDLPPNFEFVFFLNQDSPEVNCEFKLIDADGNTFMKKFYSFGSPNRWKKIVIRETDITWMWGPNSDASLDKIRVVELAVTGAGNNGTICFDQLTMRPLPPGRPRSQAKPEPWTGTCARWLNEKQAYWTMIGSPEAGNEALVCEDGTIEPLKRGFSLLPLLHVNGKVISRNEATITQSLARDHLPVPAVQWRYKNIALQIQVYVHGTTGESIANAKYSIRNDGPTETSGSLLLLTQPYQVYPPWQGGGGFSPIRQIRYTNGVIEVNGRRSIFLSREPESFLAHIEDEGPGTGVKRLEIVDGPQTIEDSNGFAASVLTYAYTLGPQESMDLYVAFPLYPLEPDITISLPPSEAARLYHEKLEETLDYWEQQVNRVDIHVAEPGLIDAFKANVAYNLITKDHEALQPGSRSYEKAWMRDGSLAALALLQVGQTQAAMDFTKWFADYQYDTGEVPPIIDTRAEDPLWEEKEKGLIEYDSQGEFIWLIAQCYAYTQDQTFLEEMFPRVIKALEFLQHLRRKRLTPDYRDAAPEKRIFYGLLPESTSHEGYDMKHSYWDDFWGLKGWEDGIAMAKIMGRTDLLPWMENELADFQTCVYDSIELVFEVKDIHYIPGCAELGDIDPTSTAAALTYCNQVEHMPQKQLLHTFDQFYQDLESRFKPGATYRITPYEVRSILAYLRLGQKGRALRLLRFSLANRRPMAWQHLAEVVHSDVRFPTYIGDMPHTWVGAELIIAIRSLFVYEQATRLVLGAGIDPVWLEDGETIAVKELPTAFGTLSYKMEKAGNEVRIYLTGTATPPDGFLLKSPLDQPLKGGVLNNEPLGDSPTSDTRFRELPADIVLRY